MARKTIRAKIIALTNHKRELLENEYNHLQHFLQTSEDLGVYSANKQQALRYYKKIKPNKEYPISIRKDLIKLEKKDTKITQYWARIPVKGQVGGVWVAIKPHCSIPKNAEICESKIKKKGDNFFLYVVIQKNVPKILPQNILAIDIGERVIATVCGSFDNRKPRFYGKNVRGIRRHYAWLRKKLGKKKLLKVIKKIGNTEKRRVTDALHKISREIVNIAKEHDAMIVIGDLEGIRNNNRKGKRFNRIINAMPFYRLTKMIEYKAEWEGIPVVKINEHDTSKTCSRCGEIGKRLTQGHFLCSNCGRRSFNAIIMPL